MCWLRSARARAKACWRACAITRRSPRPSPTTAISTPTPSSSRRRASARSIRATCWSTISTTSRTCRAPAARSSATTRRRGRRPVRQAAAEPAAMPRRHRPQHGDGHAQQRLGDRRQHAEHGRHDGDQGPRLPAGVRRQRQARDRLVGLAHQRSLGQHGGRRQRREGDAVRQHVRLRRAGSRQARSGHRPAGRRQQGDRAAHPARDRRRAARRK